MTPSPWLEARMIRIGDHRISETMPSTASGTVEPAESAASSGCRDPGPNRPGSQTVILRPKRTSWAERKLLYTPSVRRPPTRKPGPTNAGGTDGSRDCVQDHRVVPRRLRRRGSRGAYSRQQDAARDHRLARGGHEGGRFQRQDLGIPRHNGSDLRPRGLNKTSWLTAGTSLGPATASVLERVAHQIWCRRARGWWTVARPGSRLAPRSAERI